jgi:hypothetical protein
MRAAACYDAQLTERVDISSRVAAFPFDLFGGYVIRRTHGFRELAKRQTPSSHASGDAEIDEFDVIPAIDHDVVRLQTAAHDSVAMDIFERFADTGEIRTARSMGSLFLP